MTERDLDQERKEDDRRFTNSLGGLAIALFLIFIGLYVADELAAQSNLEDCVLQGRADCVQVNMTQSR